MEIWSIGRELGLDGLIRRVAYGSSSESLESGDVTTLDKIPCGVAANASGYACRQRTYRNWTKLEHTTPEETMISFLAFSRYGVSTVSTATPDALLPSKMIFLAKVDLYIEIQWTLYMLSSMSCHCFLYRVSHPWTSSVDRARFEQGR